jgi:hypothetical protein
VITADTGQPEPRAKHAAQPPWETAPAEFAAAPVPDWSISNSGPMYLWNPKSGTGPQPVIPPDENQD